MGHHLKVVDGVEVYQSDKFDVPPNHLVLNLEKRRTLSASIATCYAYAEHDPEFAEDLSKILHSLHPEILDA